MNAVGVNNRLDDLDDRVTDLDGGGGGGGDPTFRTVTIKDGTKGMKLTGDASSCSIKHETDGTATAFIVFHFNDYVLHFVPSKVRMLGKQLNGFATYEDYASWNENQLVDASQVKAAVQASLTTQVSEPTTISEYIQGCFCSSLGTVVEAGSFIVAVERCIQFTPETAK
jgi:hypothetical protein